MIHYRGAVVYIGNVCAYLADLAIRRQKGTKSWTTPWPLNCHIYNKYNTTKNCAVHHSYTSHITHIYTTVAQLQAADENLKFGAKPNVSPPSALSPIGGKLGREGGKISPAPVTWPELKCIGIRRTRIVALG